LYYEDFPYALQEPGKNDQILDSAWECEVHPLSPAALEKWQAAVAAYGSQLAQCWSTDSEMRDALRGHLDRVGGVRLWRRKKTRRLRDRRAGDGRLKCLLVPHHMAPISPFLAMAGAVSSMFEMAEGLHGTGADVTVAGVLHEGKTYRHNGVTYHNLVPAEGPDRNFSLLSDRRFDVILANRGHILEQSARYFPFAVKILRVIDNFFRSHDLPADVINLRADAIIAVSQFLKNALVEWGAREEKVEVINDGLRTDLFCRRHDIAREENLIVFAGATVPEKGILILLKACNLLMQHDPDLRLEVYGSAGLWKKQREFVDWPKITSVRPNVVFKGPTKKENIAHAFNRASLCVVPSDPKAVQEGFGRVSMEAQACGCPVVVSRSGGLPETMVEGETGVIVDPLTEETLADAIGSLLADRGRRDEMSRQAEQYAKRFTVDDAARAFLDVIEEKRNTAAPP
ncbi:MAG: glycosyltransferase family 4 protein, partial [Nitrospinota bacterium]